MPPEVSVQNGQRSMKHVTTNRLQQTGDDKQIIK